MSCESYLATAWQFLCGRTVDSPLPPWPVSWRSGLDIVSSALRRDPVEHLPFPSAQRSNSFHHFLGCTCLDASRLEHTQWALLPNQECGLTLAQQAPTMLHVVIFGRPDGMEGTFAGPARRTSIEDGGWHGES